MLEVRELFLRGHVRIVDGVVVSLWHAATGTRLCGRAFFDANFRLTFLLRTQPGAKANDGAGLGAGCGLSSDEKLTRQSA